jgi:hypothetical protein
MSLNLNYDNPLDRAIIQNAVEPTIKALMSALVDKGLTPEQAGKALRHCTHRLEGAVTPLIDAEVISDVG